MCLFFTFGSLKEDYCIFSNEVTDHCRDYQTRSENPLYKDKPITLLIHHLLKGGTIYMIFVTLIFIPLSMAIGFRCIRQAVVNHELWLKIYFLNMRVINRRLADLKEYNEIKIAKTMGGGSGEIRIFTVGLKGKEKYTDIFQMNDYSVAKKYAENLSKVSNIPVKDEV